MVEFLTEFARFMLASGMSIAQFQSAAQLAFLQAATADARMGNSRVNQSAVAAMTGLTRSQVRSMLRDPDIVLANQRDRLHRLIAGWQSDSAYVSKAGVPRKLPLSNGPGSFAALARKYGKDVPYRALLAELQRQRYVRIAEDCVHLSRLGKNLRRPTDLQQLSQAFAYAIKPPNQSGECLVNVIAADAVYETPAAMSKILLKRRLEQGAHAFVADVQSAAAATVVARRPRPNRRMSRTSILVVTME